MNKNTKIWVNYGVGACISLLLLWGIYTEVHKQAALANDGLWVHTGAPVYLWLCIGLMLANTSLEGYKWRLLANKVQPMPYYSAFASYLAGVAFAAVTPNRIGEYPGRILYIGRRNTFRYIHVSVVGVMAQLWSVYVFGLAGLVYYTVAHPGVYSGLALTACATANILLAIGYFRFETWLPVLERIKWLKRYVLYGKLLTRATVGWNATILCVSLLRVAIFTAQYLFFLRWMNVNVPLVEGYCTAALFFWAMAIIPSIAFTGFASRVKIALMLFLHFSSNAHGIIAATVGVWALNIVAPAVFGSILILRMKLIR